MGELLNLLINLRHKKEKNKRKNKKKLSKMGRALLRFSLPTVPKFMNSFFAVGATIQLVILILLSVYTTWPETEAAANGVGSAAGATVYDPTQYAVLMDVMVMIFVGFAVLFCLLPKYGWTGISIALLIGSMTFEWNLLMGPLIAHGVDAVKQGVIINIDTLAESIFCAASVLIACAGLLGRASLEQFVILMFCMVPAYNFNMWIVISQIGATDTGGTIFIHAFGAFFGFACSWVLGHDEGHSMKRRFSEDDNYHTNIFALLGTIFLWVYYPSFNCYGMVGLKKFRATFNTQLALIAAACTSIILSDMTEHTKKSKMIHMQTGVLAGGVTLGCLADHPIQPWGAILLGSVGAVVCILGIKYLTPFMEEKLKVHDTCDCMALHGIPAFFSVFASCISYAAQKKGGAVTNDYWVLYDAGQCGKQIGAIFACAGLALAFGLPTGLIMGCFSRDDHWYDEGAHFDKNQ